MMLEKGKLRAGEEHASSKCQRNGLRGTFSHWDTARREERSGQV